MTDRIDIVERLREGVKIGDIPLHGDPNITWAVPDVGEARKVMHEAASTIEDLAAALEWYAEQVADCRKITSPGNTARQALDRDGGERARAALAKSRWET